ncbi:MAG: delta-lactam-biosynthetic de-N-acetylase [Syntrophomonadaceae bacterium]|nr:delta-lactam-biosynthetic de-N-acetylase [Syntrophomonadaceae bacterium]MDD3889192.1 delta-lactam-biosynthetic de-N-acetylase [Syntrophomonadaceae bacterium]MDD4549813.1 delta-lactam-biosynthetic de-N-acetylase [Syntrophomonadaceae bacterium]
MTKHITMILFLTVCLAIIPGCTENKEALTVSTSNYAVVSPDIADNQKPDTPPVETEDKSQNTPDEVVKNEPTNTTVELSSKSLSWYLQPNSEHKTPYINDNIGQILSERNAFYVWPGNDNSIYLTFDEGYELGYTSKILDTLQANNVQAAFFITGHYLKSQPELVKRMKNEGHLVCNHTWNHPDLSTVTPDKITQEIISLQQKFSEVTGYEMDKYLRPPMGNYSEQSLEYTSQAGYTTVFWSLAFADWDPNNQPGANFSYEYVMKHVHPGAVILLHAVSSSNTEALDKIIKDLQNEGYTFATFNS